MAQTDSAFPSIVIVTASCNRENFLPACMDSVIHQRYPNLQYVVMDGGSTDGSVEIIKAREKDLHFWRTQPDGGAYAAIEEGFARSDAEIMGWINADDTLLPWALGVVGGIFRDCPEVEWITTETPLAIGADGLPIGNWRIPGFTKDGFRRRENLPAPGAPNGASFIQQESTFWRRPLWHRAGGRLDGSLKFARDFELWDRFFDHALLYSIDFPLGTFRRHGIAQASVEMSSQYFSECEAVLVRHGNMPPNFMAYAARQARMAGLNIGGGKREPIHVVRRQQDTGRFVAGQV